VKEHKLLPLKKITKCSFKDNNKLYQKAKKDREKEIIDSEKKLNYSSKKNQLQLTC
jgi:hypothetical protein